MRTTPRIRRAGPAAVAAIVTGGGGATGATATGSAASGSTAAATPDPRLPVTTQARPATRAWSARCCPRWC